MKALHEIAAAELVRAIEKIERLSTLFFTLDIALARLIDNQREVEKRIAEYEANRRPWIAIRSEFMVESHDPLPFKEEA